LAVWVELLSRVFPSDTQGYIYNDSFPELFNLYCLNMKIKP